MNNIGLAKKLLKSKNIGHKLTGAYFAATSPLATALGGTALNLKAGYKGAKKAITGKDSAYHDSLIVMAYRKRQLKDAKYAYLKALGRKSNLCNDSDNLIIAKYNYCTAIKRYNDSVLDTIIQKVKAAANKAINALHSFSDKFPSISKVISAILAITGIIDGIKGSNALRQNGKMIAGRILSNVKQGQSALDGIKGDVPSIVKNVAHNFFVVAGGACKLFVATQLRK